MYNPDPQQPSYSVSVTEGGSLSPSGGAGGPKFTIIDKLKVGIIAFMIASTLTLVVCAGYWFVIAKSIDLEDPERAIFNSDTNGTMDPPLGNYAVFVDKGSCNEAGGYIKFDFVDGGKIQDKFTKDCDSIYRNSGKWIFVGEIEGAQSGKYYRDEAWTVEFDGVGDVVDTAPTILISKDWIVENSNMEDNFFLIFVCFIVCGGIGGALGESFVTKSKESNKNEEPTSNVGQNVSQAPIERDPYDLFDEDPFS